MRGLRGECTYMAGRARAIRRRTGGDGKAEERCVELGELLGTAAALAVAYGANRKWLDEQI